MSRRSNIAIAKESAHKIREFWRSRPDKDKFSPVLIEVDPISFALKSNMVNGYPPSAKARTR